MISYRTSEWYKARIGKFTASGFHSLMTNPADKTSAYSKSALNYIEKTAAQLYFNRYYESPDSDATRWGVRYEALAIQKFTEKTGFETSQCGFVIHTEHEDVGATPDCIVEDLSFPDLKIIAQVKCPYNTIRHNEYISGISDATSLMRKKAEYFWQIQGELWVTGASFAYFVSYDPRQGSNEDLWVVRIDRDQIAIDALSEKVIDAIKLRNEILDQFKSGRRIPKDLKKYW